MFTKDFGRRGGRVGEHPPFASGILHNVPKIIIIVDESFPNPLPQGTDPPPPLSHDPSKKIIDVF